MIYEILQNRIPTGLQFPDRAEAWNYIDTHDVGEGEFTVIGKEETPKEIRHYPIRERELYKNKGGSVYMCLQELDRDTYVMQNVNSGWTFTAHVITRYENGDIEWDYSSNGRFEEVKE